MLICCNKINIDGTEMTKSSAGLHVEKIYIPYRD
jgi:hypothetical protein